MPLTVAGRYSFDINRIDIGSTRTLWLTDGVLGFLQNTVPATTTVGEGVFGDFDVGVHPVWLSTTRFDAVPGTLPDAQYEYYIYNDNILNSFCNGTVAHDVISFSTTQLAALTAGGAHDEVRNYRYGSPAGCNTSNYTVHSRIERYASNDDTAAIVPSQVRLRNGASVDFQGVRFAGGVSWSVVGGAAQGIIDPVSGHFTATRPLDPHGVVAVQATDGAQTATAFVGLAP